MGPRTTRRRTLQTLAQDDATANHFLAQCNMHGCTRLLARRPSLKESSLRVYCQKCGDLVRLIRCRCITCNNVLSNRDCTQRGSVQHNKQLTLRECLVRRGQG